FRNCRAVKLPYSDMNNAIHSSTPESQSARHTRDLASSDGQSFKFSYLLILLHIPLGVLLYNRASLGLIHPLVCFAVGMRRALLAKEESLVRVAEVAAYIVGAEVLWRMTRVPIFWEFGKYSVAIIMMT